MDNNNQDITLSYDLSSEKKENITIDYRNSNYKFIQITIPEIIEKPLTVKQDFRLGKGGIFWDGSYFMSKYLIENYFNSEHPPSSTSIIELGAGTALPSLTALVKGYSVITTDLPKFVPFMKDIISLNTHLFSNANQSTVCQLSWENQKDIDYVKSLNNNKPFDLIIGSELIYLDDLFDDLINVLKQLSNESTMILLTYKIRLQEMVDDFINKVTKYFNIEYINYELTNQLYPKPEKLKLVRLVLINN